MSRYKAPRSTYGMKTSKFVPVTIFVSAICILLDIQSPAWGTSLERSPANRLWRTAASKCDLRLAQNSEPAKPEIVTTKKTAGLAGEIGVTRSNSDRSLLTVTGSIENRSDQPHFVYYIVAKLIVNDTSIKQTIIPVNSDIEPGKSKSFTHEVSTNTSESQVPEAVVVKYEYR